VIGVGARVDAFEGRDFLSQSLHVGGGAFQLQSEIVPA